MAELSLLEAFRRCGPTIGDPTVDDPRREAMVRIHEELQDLARRLRRYGELAEDAASETLLRFVQRGPLGERPGHPVDDGGARRYLRRCLRNGIEDIRRRGKHEVLTDSDHVLEPGPSASKDSELENFREILGHDALGQELEAAATHLFEEVVPFVESHLRSPAREPFRVDIEQRRCIAEGRKTIEEGVQELFGHLDRQTRNRFDQRQCRSLKRLGDGLETYVKFSGTGPTETHALRLVLQALKDREVSWGTPPEVSS